MCSSCGGNRIWIVTAPDGTVTEYPSAREARNQASAVGGTWKRKPR